jgi:hypothetical protein
MATGSRRRRPARDAVDAGMRPHATQGGPGSCVLRYVMETRIVRATVLGVMDLGAFVRCASEAVALGERHGTLRLLFDGRKAQPWLPATEIHAMPESAEQHGLTPRHRLALIYATRTVEPMDMLLWENVFVNRGYRARAFVDEDQALQWLSQE